MTPRSHARLAAIALAVAALAGPAGAAETLRWKFKEGESFRYVLDQTTENTATVQGQEFGTTISQTVTILWTVGKVEEDGSAAVTQTIEGMKIALESPLASFTFDSAADDNPGEPAEALKPVIEALVGADIALTMTARGEITEVTVPEGMLEKLKSAGPAAQALQGLSTPEGMKTLIGQSTLVLPEDPVEKGATWDRSMELPTPQVTMKLTNTMTYEGIGEGGLADIGLKMVIDELVPAPNSPLEMTLKDQNGGGAYHFDVERGLLRSSEVNQQLTLSIAVQGQQISSVADTTAEFRLVEDEGESKGE